MKNTVETLNDMNACDEAVEWVKAQTELGKTPSWMWKHCPRGDWMLWLVGKTEVPREQIVMAACACARMALPFVTKGEDRPRIAIETTEAWCRGEATIEQVRRVRADAANAANAGAWTVNAAAMSAVWAADARADAQAAAQAAVWAADADAADANLSKAQRKTAIVVAKHISWATIKSPLEAVL